MSIRLFLFCLYVVLFQNLYKCTIPLAATQRLLITLLTEIKSDLAELKKKADHHSQLLAKLQEARATEDDFELPDGLDFPLKSLEDVDVLENLLETDPNLHKRLYTDFTSRLWCLSIAV